MLKLAGDEDLKSALVLGLRRRLPRLDLVTVEEAGRRGAEDPEVLAWAAAEDRVVLTHDRRTMPRHAYHRLKMGEPLPGVIIVPQRTPIGRAIDDVALLVEIADPSELRDRVTHVPL